MRLFYLLASFVVFFYSCSTKNTFNPSENKIIQISPLLLDFKYLGDTNPTIKTKTKFISKNLSLDIKDTNTNIVNILFSNKNHILISNKNGFSLVLKNNFKIIKTIKTQSLIISGFIDDKIIATLSINNQLNIYDISTFENIFSHKENTKVSISKNIAYFVKNKNILYVPFLNAKLLLFDIPKNKIQKIYKIDYMDKFSNTKGIAIRDDFIFAYTKHKLFSLYKNKSYFNNSFNIKSAIYKNNNIYIADNNGYIYMLDKKLNIKEKKHFKNGVISHLYFYKNQLFFTENRGYVVLLDGKLNIQKAFHSSFLQKTPISFYENKLYFNNHFLDMSILLK